MTTFLFLVFFFLSFLSGRENKAMADGWKDAR
jgi:hypothetical protein